MRISVLLLLTTSQVSTYRSIRLLSSNQWDRASVIQEMKDRLRLCGREGRMHSPPAPLAQGATRLTWLAQRARLTSLAQGAAQLSNRAPFDICATPCTTLLVARDALNEGVGLERGSRPAAAP